MFHMLSSLWDIITIGAMWTTLLIAFSWSCMYIYRIYRHEINKKNVLLETAAFFLSVGYLMLYFIIGKNSFEFIFSVFIMIFAVIAIQFQKYEDRKAGRRWWEQ